MRIVKRIVKRALLLCLLLAVTLVGCVFYAFKIEPYRLVVNQYALNGRQEGESRIKLVQISDLHIKEDFTYEDLRRVVARVNEQKPDIVVFTGDLYDNYAAYHDDERVISELSAIEARYGKVAVWGNRDYGGGAARRYPDIMGSAGFALLRNEDWHVTLENGRTVWLTGLDDSLLGNPGIPDAADRGGADVRILLSHEPDTVERFLDSGYEAALSGHSHGGQIRIPFLPSVNEKAVAATSLSTKYSGGMYDVGDGRGMKLYVNTGIGTTHISARFGVTPEIALFHVFLPD